jgi:hypothetical protein
MHFEVADDDQLHEGMPVVDPQGKVDGQASLWGSLWGRDGQRKVRVLELLNSLRPRAREVLDTWGPLTMSMLVKSIRSFSSSAGVSMDDLTFRLLKSLDPQVLQALLDLLSWMEQMLMFPGNAAQGKTALLPKPTGEVCPIALLATLYRLWNHMRLPQVKKWEANHTAEWDAATRGSSALKAACASELHLELSKLEGKHSAALLIELEKFYDNVDLEILTHDAIGQSYPRPCLIFAFETCLMPRVLTMQ